MIKINLLAEGKKPAAVRRVKTPAASGGAFRKEELAQWFFGGALLLAFAAIGGWWWYLSSEIKRKDQEIREAQIEVAKLQDIIREVEGYKKKKGELEHKIAVIQDLKANQRGPVRVMDEISRSLPELLWLTNVDMTANRLKINGRSFNLNAVATFIENLDRVPEFQEPELLDSKREGEVFSFQLQVAYKPVVPAANQPGAPAAPAAPASGQAPGTRAGG